MAGSQKKAPPRGRFFYGTVLYKMNSPWCVVAAISLAAIIFFPGCSSADPEIMQVEARIIISRGGASLAEPSHRDESMEERLSVHVDARDPDGIDDIGWMVVEFPRHGIGWHLEGETLRSRAADSRHWFGSDDLVVPGLPQLPRGTLRVTLGDLAGRTAVREVQLPPRGVYPQEGDFPGLRQSASGDDVLFVPAPAGQRHFLVSRDHRRELYIPEGITAADAARGVRLTREEVQRFSPGPVWVIAEVTPALWLEWGGVVLPAP